MPQPLEVFLAKPDGGWRPIGLMCFWLRPWDRIRRKYCAQWEADHQLPEIWGCSSDTSCDRAAYLHNLFLVQARAAGFEGASVYFDISKFYERIDHGLLKQAAEAHGFDVGLVKALCVAYAGPRRATVDGAVSEEIRAVGTVIAGCSCATTMARLILHDLITRSRALMPIGRVINVIDDISGHGIASRGVLVRRHPRVHPLCRAAERHTE